MIRPICDFKLSIDRAIEISGAKVFENGAKSVTKNLEFTGVTLSDKDILPGDIFIASAGEKVHGAQFAEAAFAKGAVAVITDSEGAGKIKGGLILVVDEPKISGALLASHLYKDPFRDLPTIAITGTNGKTSVSMLLHQIFTFAGRECGLIGTVETRIGRDIYPSSRTTPEAPELQSLAATMRERHVRNLVMEVSSHAITLKRIHGSHFSISAFTNLSQDHLDFHKDMQSYFEAKAKLFTYEFTDLAFINIDSDWGQKLFAQVDIPKISISRNNAKAGWSFARIEKSGLEVEISIRGTEGILIESKTRMRGGFNLDNLLLAVAIACESGVDPVEVAASIPVLIPAPGRLQEVSLGQNFGAYVDYAHTPDAVINVLKTVSEFSEGKVIAVLGCGGDRDKTKRAPMGEALFSGSNIAIFTSDNPRSEKAENILEDMVASLVIAKPSIVISDRRAAIQYAVEIAQPKDVVIILGKGHEAGQEISGVIYPFDDLLALIEEIGSKDSVEKA